MEWNKKKLVCIFVVRVYVCNSYNIMTQSKYMLNVEVSGRTYNWVDLKFNKYEWMSSLLPYALVLSLVLKDHSSRFYHSIV